MCRARVFVSSVRVLKCPWTGLRPGSLFFTRARAIHDTHGHMSAIGKLVHGAALTVYANRDGSLWIRIDGRRKRLHGNHHWVKHDDGRVMRGQMPLISDPLEHAYASDDSDEQFDGEQIAIALSLSMQDAGDVAVTSQVAAQTAATSSTATAPRACSICMDGIEAGQAARGLACGHSFHTACITRWLRRSSTCPDCRHSA